MEAIRQVFAQWDADHDGYLNLEDMLGIRRKLGLLCELISYFASQHEVCVVVCLYVCYRSVQKKRPSP